jgi:hypothetical protein
MCLTGILKNIILVVVSVVIWGTPITLLQTVGYTLACFGLVYYSVGWAEMSSQSSYSWALAKKMWDDNYKPSAEESADNGSIVNLVARQSTLVRRATLAGVGFFAIALLYLGYSYSGTSGVIRDWIA